MIEKAMNYIIINSANQETQLQALQTQLQSNETLISKLNENLAKVLLKDQSTGAELSINQKIPNRRRSTDPTPFDGDEKDVKNVKTSTSTGAPNWFEPLLSTRSISTRTSSDFNTLPACLKDRPISNTGRSSTSLL